MQLRDFRRATAFSTVLALSVCSLGLPLPVRVVKEFSEPFPCMDCPCSCGTADRCWEDCCCYSPEEKLAWAREHGVIPPATLLAKLAEPACCEQRQVASCCARAKPSCCNAKKSCCAKPASEPPRREWGYVVLVMQELRCHGFGSTATLLPPVTVDVAGELTGFDPTPIGTIAEFQQFYWGYCASPEVPPPRSDA